MITIHHKRATFTVQPEKAEAYREALAKLDKGKGPKFKKSTNPKFDSMKRHYPPFFPGMDTAAYISDYMSRNDHVKLAHVDYVFADRAAPMLNPSIPEVEHETL